MRARGHTLLETMVSLFIILMVLGAIGALVKNYSSVMQHSRGKDRTLIAAQLALNAVKLELEAARWGTVTTGGSAVQFQRVNPQVRALTGYAPGHLPAQFPGAQPPTPPWNGFPASALVTVRFFLDAGTGRLLRDSSVGGTQPVTDGLQGFNSTGVTGGYRLTATITEDKKVLTLSTVAVLHLEP